MSNYNSVLLPEGPDKMDFDWYRDELLNLPTEQLKEKYNEYL